MTPGQAAYEAFAEEYPGEKPAPWEDVKALYPCERDAWERIAQAADSALREKLAALATEMHAEADRIAPASSEPDGMPDLTDQVRAQVLHEYAARIRQVIERGGLPPLEGK